MEKLAPIDVHGNDLQVGDWVRVIAVPLSIKDMPIETKEAFSDAVGHTLQIVAFDETGCLELEMWPKVSLDTVWLEPYCVKRFRRYKRLSKSFQRMLDLTSAPRPPRYEIKFDITVKEGVDIEEFIQRLLSFGTGGGYACWPDERRIDGSVYADKSEPDAIDILKNVRQFIEESAYIDVREVSDIADADET